MRDVVTTLLSRNFVSPARGWRLLAFSTTSHMGIVITGFSLLDRVALAGMVLSVLGHGMVKASLFICAGILLHPFESVDEFELEVAGRRMPWTGMVMFLGALGLASVPPFLNFFGESKIERNAICPGSCFWSRRLAVRPVA
jgi:multicomponent Na+:H+ antiporter subunit D